MMPDDLTALKRAVEALEHPSFAARLANMVGKSIELIEHALPLFAASAIATATSKALEAAMQVAVRTLRREPHAGSQGLHKILATASGAAGGAFGLATLAIEHSSSASGPKRTMSLCRGMSAFKGRSGNIAHATVKRV